MTGGMAYVYDVNATFSNRLNNESVVAGRIASAYWEEVLKALIVRHQRETHSPLAAAIVKDWNVEKMHFWQICPKEMLTRLAHPLDDATIQQPLKRRA